MVTWDLLPVHTALNELFAFIDSSVCACQQEPAAVARGGETFTVERV